jgi:hypothetical protein
MTRQQEFEKIIKEMEKPSKGYPYLYIVIIIGIFSVVLSLMNSSHTENNSIPQKHIPIKTRIHSYLPSPQNDQNLSAISIYFKNKMLIDKAFIQNSNNIQDKHEKIIIVPHSKISTLIPYLGKDQLSAVPYQKREKAPHLGNHYEIIF